MLLLIFDYQACYEHWTATNSSLLLISRIFLYTLITKLLFPIYGVSSTMEKVIRKSFTLKLFSFVKMSYNFHTVLELQRNKGQITWWNTAHDLKIWWLFPSLLLWIPMVFLKEIKFSFMWQSLLSDLGALVEMVTQFYYNKRMILCNSFKELHFSRR